MDTCVLHAQSLKRVGVGQHRTPLLDQGGEATGEVVRLSHAERKHLLGFLWGWRTTQGGQAQRDAIGLLALAHPVVLGPPEQRCDGSGTARQADFVEPQRRGRLELVWEGAGTLTAHGCGRRWRR